MTDDLIRRQAAIATAISGRVRTLPTTEDGEDWIRVNEVRESLLNLPTAEPDMARAIATILENEQDMRVIKRNAEPRWIPVTERLPEEDSDILVTYIEKDEKRIVPVNYGRGSWFDCVFDRSLNPVGVLAWMPLPTPWKGESDEDNN